MIKFKDFSSGLFRAPLENPSVEACLEKNGSKLFLKFTSKDIISGASYSGPFDPWLSSLCHLIIGKDLVALIHLNWSHWDEAFREDQTYWDLKAEKEDDFLFYPVELLRAAIDIYRGRDYLYKDPNPLICRCFGVRESDVMSFLATSPDATLEALAKATKASMGCRSCVPQLNRLLTIKQNAGKNHFYKDKTRSYWIEEIDYMLSCFPEAFEWKMELKSFKKNQVIISYDKEVSQSQEEILSEKLQDFLALALDADLAFFLIRSRQRSKA